MSRQTLLCGHQPGFHHPGILAKRVRQHEVATDHDLKTEWILVDQDVGDPGAIRFPDLDEQGNLIERTWQVISHRPDHPTGTTPWKHDLKAPPNPSSKIPNSVGTGLQDIYRALQAAEGETVAERFHNAQENLLQERMTEMVGPAPKLLRASTILRTPQGMSILASILEAPEACALAWNDAARLVPRSARALKIDPTDPDRTEVPCWTLDRTGRRVPATVKDLRNHLHSDGELYPRAFLMTAIIRSTSQWPMIHGTGGGRYELVTDQWAAQFLGIELPPISVATANLRLPLLAPGEDPEAPDPLNALRKLEHDPWPDKTIKAEMAQAIRQAPRRSPQRRALFDEMQAALARERCRIAARLELLEEQGRSRVLESKQRRIATDRAWPWPLYEDEALRGMKLETTSLDD